MFPRLSTADDLIAGVALSGPCECLLPLQVLCSQAQKASFLWVRIACLPAACGNSAGMRTDWHDLTNVSSQMEIMHSWLAVSLTSGEVRELMNWVAEVASHAGEGLLLKDKKSRLIQQSAVRGVALQQQLQESRADHREPAVCL